jgi:hypothetical protein
MEGDRFRLKKVLDRGAEALMMNVIDSKWVG